mgnify:CR=1 FL=1|jgi:hypothetical protein
MSNPRYWRKPNQEYKEYCQKLAKSIRADIKARIGKTLPDTKYTVRTYAKANQQDIEIRFRSTNETKETLNKLGDLYYKYDRGHNSEGSGCIRIKIFSDLDGEVFNNL